jgi:hypothetical protein
METIELQTSVEIPTITFLNSLGDVTIIWDKKDNDAVKKLIAKKMKDGVAFFIIEKKG